jgi:prepilin-type N-terminal cleavage/methylation domain-containing protein
MMKHRKQSGFSLIELLIVVAIILIVAAIALPNLMAGRMAANEASAVESLRTLQSAETAYSTTFPAVGYSSTLLQLGGSGSGICLATPAQACLIDSTLASGIKGGYQITWHGDGLTPSVYYSMNADPLARGSSGRRSFYTDYPGVIRYNDTAPAAVTDPVI